MNSRIRHYVMISFVLFNFIQFAESVKVACSQTYLINSSNLRTVCDDGGFTYVFENGAARCQSQTGSTQGDGCENQSVESACEQYSFMQSSQKFECYRMTSPQKTIFKCSNIKNVIWCDGQPSRQIKD
ncbi:hypothetical protein DFH28DRAFT_27862 [Melampsora americana]|nr:hypothetical protein DFH28DRAFT_27862 [Melampsora americana]